MEVRPRLRPSSRLLRPGNAGFTLVELLVVMAILAMLLSIAVPRYFESVERAKEAALRANLRLMRESIDKYYADKGQLPGALVGLADAHYLRAVPLDTVTDSATTWVEVGNPDGVTPGLYDVRSGAPGLGRDGTAYQSW